MPRRDQTNETYSDQEARERFEKALRAGLSMPPTPHADMKLGKPRGRKRKASAARKDHSSKSSRG